MDIDKKIQQNKEQIVKLLNENIDLKYQKDLESYASFSEGTRKIGRGKNAQTIKVKIGHWKEFFKDAAYPDDESKGVWIERSQIIEINGRKSNNWNVIKYFNINDIR